MILEESIHFVFKETNLMDTKKDDDEIGTLLEALKKMNFDDSNQEKVTINE